MISCVFNVFNVTMNHIVTSEGAAKTTMCALLTGAVLNMGLDSIFIYVLDLGSAGAAIAAAIAQAASTLIYLFYIGGKKAVKTSVIWSTEICGLNGVLYAQPAADVISVILTAFMAVRLRRELNEEALNQAEKQAIAAERS